MLRGARSYAAVRPLEAATVPVRGHRGCPLPGAEVCYPDGRRRTAFPKFPGGRRALLTGRRRKANVARVAGRRAYQAWVDGPEALHREGATPAIAERRRPRQQDAGR